MSFNRELVETAYAALNERELEKFLTSVHPGVEFHSLIAEAEGCTYRGHAGACEWWDSVASALGGLRYEPQEFRESEDWVLSRVVVTGRAVGVDVSQTMWQAVRIEDGLSKWWNTYRTQREAFEVAGIEG
jgi:hypothetical protein